MGVSKYAKIHKNASQIIVLLHLGMEPAKAQLNGLSIDNNICPRSAVGWCSQYCQWEEQCAIWRIITGSNYSRIYIRLCEMSDKQLILNHRRQSYRNIFKTQNAFAFELSLLYYLTPKIRRIA